MDLGAAGRSSFMPFATDTAITVPVVAGYAECWEAANRHRQLVVERQLMHNTNARSRSSRRPGTLQQCPILFPRQKLASIE